MKIKFLKVISKVNCLDKLFLKFKPKSERSKKLTINVFFSFFLKGLSILIGLILVPLTIGYVDAERYGIWLAISSIVAWVGYFDIGLSNGLRNKFAEMVAIGNFKKAREYVSTTYALLCVIFIPLIIIFSILSPLINWAKILNVNASDNENLVVVAIIVFTYFCLKIILDTINIILIADQRPANASFRKVIEQISSLIAIFLLVKFTEGSLLNLTIGLCIAPLIVILFFNFLLFSSRYKNVSPKKSSVDFSLVNELFILGGKFFVIQIAILIQFQTANLIIIRYFGGESVTSYNIARKYFSILSMFFTIFISPLWSSVTNAMALKDYEWIKRTVTKYNRIVIIFFLGGLGMLLLSPFAYDFWIGKNVVEIPFVLSLWVFVFVFSTIFGKVQGAVLNGIGALKIQFYASMISPLIFIGISYLMLIKLQLGLSSIVIASIIANFNGYLLAPIQYNKIFIQNKKGIWTK